MPEHDNDSDKLEQFFQKAASRPDILFNEDDWKKLEAQLDSLPPPLSVTRSVFPRIVAAVLISLVFVTGSFYWTQGPVSPGGISSETPGNEGLIAPGIGPRDLTTTDHALDDTRNHNGSPETDTQTIEPADPEAEKTSSLPRSAKLNPSYRKSADGFSASEIINSTLLTGANDTNSEPTILRNSATPSGAATFSGQQSWDAREAAVTALDKDKILSELLSLSTNAGERIKQKAGGQLPGAEEADGLNHEASVKVAKASEEKTALASPRLSLLLSLAPDFSSTSINKYTSPGGAYGAMIHYHFRNRWSISAGVVRSKKKYTGDGEDYQPPKGYWKYYTNGVIPESINGSCNILEIPIMLQYAFARSGRSRFLIGAGASSYLMLNESYQYTFEQPNPGAKQRWDSKNGSKFFFNMINLTVGFERQVAEGLMIGIEPYLKVPIEEIGWSNLKLYSTGASFTLRYRIINKNASPLTRSRSPD